jgi:hypothetical protein
VEEKALEVVIKRLRFIGKNGQAAKDEKNVAP